MGRSDGPHTRNPVPGLEYRGSKKRIDELSPFDGLPVAFWLFAAVAIIMTALTFVIIWQASLTP